MISNKRTRFTKSLLFVTLFMGWFNPSAFAAFTLTEAETYALQNDPMVAQQRAESLAMMEQSFALGSWKDPQLSLGLVSLPLDTFDREQEAMTQQKIGLTQGFPRGDSLRFKQEQTQSEAQGKNLQALLEEQKIRRDVRLQYLDVVYQRLAYQTVKKSQKFFQQLKSITQFRYASGKSSQQAVIEASLSYEKMQDKLLKLQTMEDVARARLSKWIGKKQAFGTLVDDFPKLSPLPSYADMLRRLTDHPSVQGADAAIHAQSLGISYAQEQYKPGWMVDINYGLRQGDNPNGTPRSDFASLMVAVDLPLFPKNRQDRVRESSQIKWQAAQLGRDDRLRSLGADLETQYALFTHLGERLALHSTQLIPQSQQFTQTTMTSYQSQVADLTDVVRAQLAELTTRLEQLEVRYNRLLAQIQLRFIIGEAL